MGGLVAMVDWGRSMVYWSMKGGASGMVMQWGAWWLGLMVACMVKRAISAQCELGFSGIWWGKTMVESLHLKDIAVRLLMSNNEVWSLVLKVLAWVEALAREPGTWVVMRRVSLEYSKEEW